MVVQALDRDPPQGRGVWRLRVEVRDGQWWGKDQNSPSLPRHYSPSHPHRQASWGRQEPQLDPDPDKGVLGGWEDGGAVPGAAGVAATGDTDRSGRKERHASLVRTHVAPSSGSGTPILGWMTQHKSSIAQTVEGVDRPRPEKRYQHAENKCKFPCEPEQQEGGGDDQHGAAGPINNYGMTPRDLQVRFEDASEKSSLVPTLTFDTFTPAVNMQDMQNHQQQQGLTPAHSSGNTTQAVKSEHLEKPPADNHLKPPSPPPLVRHDPSGTLTDHHDARVEGEAANGSRHTMQMERGQKERKSNHKPANPTEPRPRQGRKAMIAPPHQHTPHTFSKGEKEEDSSPHFGNNVFESSGTSYSARSNLGDTRSHRISRGADDITFTSLGDILMEEDECEDVTVIGSEYDGVEGDGSRRLRVHVVETEVTVVVKDINDNAPVFPNATMVGHVQENGAAGECAVF